MFCAMELQRRLLKHLQCYKRRPSCYTRNKETVRHHMVQMCVPSRHAGYAQTEPLLQGETWAWRNISIPSIPRHTSIHIRRLMYNWVGSNPSHHGIITIRGHLITPRRTSIVYAWLAITSIVQSWWAVTSIPFLQILVAFPQKPWIFSLKITLQHIVPITKVP